MWNGGTARWVVLWCCVAFSASGAPNRQQAGAHFQRAVVLFQADDFLAALAEFRAAYDAAPSYEVLWNIGLCEKKLARYGDAVATLEAYLKQGGARIPPDRRAAVAEHLRYVRAMTAPLSVHTSGAPATIVLDGEQIGFTPMERVLVPLGRHTVRLEREGFEPLSVTRELVAGQPVDVALELQALPPGARKTTQANSEHRTESVGKRPRATEEVPRPTPSHPFSTLGVLGLSLGAAAIGGGIAFGIAGREVSGEISALFQSGGTWDETWVAKERWGQTARTLCPLSIIVGLGLASAGGIMLTVSLNQSTDAPMLTHLLVAPIEGGAYAAVGGSF